MRYPVHECANVSFEFKYAIVLRRGCDLVPQFALYTAAVRYGIGDRLLLFGEGFFERIETKALAGEQMIAENIQNSLEFRSHSTTLGTAYLTPG